MQCKRCKAIKQVCQYDGDPRLTVRMNRLKTLEKLVHSLVFRPLEEAHQLLEHIRSANNRGPSLGPGNDCHEIHIQLNYEASGSVPCPWSISPESSTVVNHQGSSPVLLPTTADSLFLTECLESPPRPIPSPRGQQHLGMTSAFTFPLPMLIQPTNKSEIRRVSTKYSPCRILRIPFNRNVARFNRGECIRGL